MARFLILTFIALLHSAAAQADAASNDSRPASDSSRYQAALEAPERLEGDAERDAGRLPDRVLEFFGVEPGMTVLDLYSGGGYYTELLSRVVGPEGKVLAHNNQAYLGFAGAEIERRYANDRLGNVQRILAENNELELPASSLDAISMVLTFHDIYYEAPGNGWPAIDGPALLAELNQALKPGGTVLVVDHYAEAGSPPSTGNTTHRIDPAIVVADMEAAGFERVAQADFLRNPADDYTVSVFDPSVRGSTDRFILKFRKR